MAYINKVVITQFTKNGQVYYKLKDDCDNLLGIAKSIIINDCYLSPRFNSMVVVPLYDYDCICFNRNNYSLSGCNLIGERK